MASLNKAQLIGYLGDEPKVERLQSGNVKATLSLATTEKGYTTKSGSVIPDRTEWHSVIFWGNLAETCEKYLHKSACIYVEGIIRNRAWDDQNGLRHYRTEIEGKVLQLLDRKPADTSGQAASQSAPQTQANGQYAPTYGEPAPRGEDDLPF